MASISRDKNGTKRVLFTDEQGMRRTVRLGAVNAKAAESFKLRVEALIAARRMGIPFDSELAAWLRDLPDTMYGRLAAVGLIESRVNATVVTLEMLLKRFEESSMVKPATRAAWQPCIKSLLGQFGADKPIGSLTIGHAEDWHKCLSESKYAVATIAKFINISKTIFRKAVKWGLITKSPFEDLRRGSQTNQARSFYVTDEMMKAVLEVCADDHWRGVLILCRYAGLRCPSELVGLKWSDINWENNRMTVKSPKTARHEGHAFRMVPIAPNVKQILLSLFHNAEVGAEAVLPRLRNATTNLRTTVVKYIARAGLTPWPRTFQNLRASCETDWVDHCPAHAVAKWLGHSPLIAAQHYLHVRDAHFDLITGGAKSGALDVQNAAQHPSAALRTHSHEASKTTCYEGDLRANAKECDATQNKEVGATGLEPVTFAV